MRVRRAGVASWRPFRTNSGRTAHIARGAARPGKAAAWLVALGRVAHGAGAELGVGSRPQEATEMSTPNQPRGRSPKRSIAGFIAIVTAILARPQPVLKPATRRSRGVAEALKARRHADATLGSRPF